MSLRAVIENRLVSSVVETLAIGRNNAAALRDPRATESWTRELGRIARDHSAAAFSELGDAETLGLSVPSCPQDNWQDQLCAAVEIVFGETPPCGELADACRHLDDCYRKTQDLLAEDEALVAYRVLVEPAAWDEILAQTSVDLQTGLLTAHAVPLDVAPASRWTTNYEVARRDCVDHASERRLLVCLVVPRQHVLGLPETGWGSAEYHEIRILPSGNYVADVVVLEPGEPPPEEPEFCLAAESKPGVCCESWDESKHPRQHGMFAEKDGGDEPFSLKPPKPKAKQATFDTLGGKQRSLFAKKGLAGQMSLFDDGATPKDLIRKGALEPAEPVQKPTQTASPQFKNWFRDSKVVGSDGKPLVVYHGTSAEAFDAFTPQGSSKWTAGIWFAQQPDMAEIHATRSQQAMDLNGSKETAPARILPVFLSLQNPKIIDLVDSDQAPDHSEIADAKDQGHDGIIFKNALDGKAQRQDVYVVFEPQQVKSATGNKGAFDPQNPKITESLALETGTSEGVRKGWEKRRRRLGAETPEPRPMPRGAVDPDNPVAAVGMLADRYPEQLADRLAADAGVHEGYTIGQHTEMVLGVYGQEADHQHLADVSQRLGVDLERLLPTVLTLHDIGKPDAIAAGDKHRQHEFTGPLMTDLLAREGFGERDQHLAELLVGHDLLGDLLKGRGGLEETARDFVDRAREFGFEPMDVLPLQKLYFKCDTAAYPYLAEKLYRRDQDGRLQFADPQIDALEDAVAEIAGPGDLASEDVSQWSADRKMEDWKQRGTRSAVFKSFFGDWEHTPESASKVVNDRGEPQGTHEIIRVYHGAPKNIDEFDPAKIGEHGLAAGRGFYFAEDKRIAETFAEGSSSNGGTILEAYLNIRKPFDIDGWVSKADMDRIVEVAAQSQPREAWDAFDVNLAFDQDGNKLPVGESIRKTIAKEVAWNQKQDGTSLDGSLHGTMVHKILDRFFGNERVNEVLEQAGFDGLVHTSDDAYGTPNWSPDRKGSYGRCWVCFSPDQIKAVDNRGTFDPSSRNIHESGTGDGARLGWEHRGRAVALSGSNPETPKFDKDAYQELMSSWINRDVAKPSPDSRGWKLKSGKISDPLLVAAVQKRYPADRGFTVEVKPIEDLYGKVLTHDVTVYGPQLSGQANESSVAESHVAGAVSTHEFSEADVVRNEHGEFAPKGEGAVGRPRPDRSAATSKGWKTRRGEAIEKPPGYDDLPDYPEGPNEKLVKQIKSGNRQAAEQLVLDNMGLLKKLARKFTRNPDEIDDLVQEGAIYMVDKVVPGYDPKRGAAFFSYAHQRVNGHLHKLWEHKAKQERAEGQTPADDELGRKNRDILDDTEFTPEGRVEIREQEQAIADSLKALDDREAEIVQRQFGLGGKQPQSLGEIGDSLGISKNAAWKISRAAMAKLQPLLHKHRNLESLAQKVAGWLAESGAKQQPGTTNGGWVTTDAGNHLWLSDQQGELRTKPNGPAVTDSKTETPPTSKSTTEKSENDREPAAESEQAKMISDLTRRDPTIPEAAKEYLDDWLIGTLESKSKQLMRAAADKWGGDCPSADLTKPAKKAINAIYRETQKQLQEAGLETVTLYRGLENVGHLDVGEASQEQRALSSWTSKRSAAEAHAQGEGGRVIVATVPRKRIVGFFGTGMGSAPAQEFVLHGGQLDVNIELPTKKTSSGVAESWEEAKHPRDRGRFAGKSFRGSGSDNSAAVGALKDGLQVMASGAAPHPDWKYANADDFVLREGQSYEPQAKPDDVPAGEANGCYNNAYELMDAKPGRYTYVEGCVLPRGADLPIQHAWVVDRDQKVIDNTLPQPGRAYYGVPLRPWYVRQMRQLAGGAGVLANQWRVDCELFQNGLPDKARQIHESQVAETWEADEHPRGNTNNPGQFAKKGVSIGPPAGKSAGKPKGDLGRWSDSTAQPAKLVRPAPERPRAETSEDQDHQIDAILTHVDDSLEAAQTLEPEQRSSYRKSFDAALSRMPERALETIRQRIKNVAFYKDKSDLNDAYDNITGRISESDSVTAFVNQATGDMHLDGLDDKSAAMTGNLEGCYAHELTHLLDKSTGDPAVYTSDDPAWQDAWKSEIRQQGYPLSRYAAANSREGFAEFGRMLYSDPAGARSKFPKSWAFFESLGYTPEQVPEVKPSPPLAEVFEIPHYDLKTGFHADCRFKLKDLPKVDLSAVKPLKPGSRWTDTASESRVAEDWREDEHPRDRGKFTHKSGGGGTTSVEPDSRSGENHYATVTAATPPPELHAVVEHWLETLTRPEQAMLHDWGMSGRVRRLVQAEQPIPEPDRWRAPQYRQDMPAWDALLDSAPRYSGTVYRGLSLVPDEQVRAMTPGSVITLQNDQSASRLPKEARDRTGESRHGGASMLWEVDQQSGALLEAATDVFYGDDVQLGGVDEAEVVLRQGARYEVESIKFLDEQGHEFPPPGYAEQLRQEEEWGLAGVLERARDAYENDQRNQDLLPRLRDRFLPRLQEVQTQLQAVKDQEGSAELPEDFLPHQKSRGHYVVKLRESVNNTIAESAYEPDTHWHGVDLDGTLAEYDGYRGPGVIGSPISKMVERIKRWLRAGEGVKIMTARVAGEDADQEREAIEAYCLEHLGRVLPVTNEKDRWMIDIWDDRAKQVVPNTGEAVDGSD